MKNKQNLNNIVIEIEEVIVGIDNLLKPMKYITGFKFVVKNTQLVNEEKIRQLQSLKKTCEGWG